MHFTEANKPLILDGFPKVPQGFPWQSVVVLQILHLDSVPRHWPSVSRVRRVSPALVHYGFVGTLPVCQKAQ